MHVGHVWGDFLTCLGHIWDNLWTCFGHVLDMFGTCFEHVLDMFWICVGHVLDKFRKYFGQVLDNLLDKFVCNIWAIYSGQFLFAKVLLTYFSSTEAQDKLAGTLAQTRKSCE